MLEGSAGDTASTSVRAAAETDRDLFYRLLVENSRGLMCVHDLDGTLLYVNPEAAAMLGWRPEEGIGRSLREFLAPSVRYLFDEYLERIGQHSTNEGLILVRTKSGEDRVWSYRNIRIDDPGRQPFVLGQAQDVTERVSAEQANRVIQAELAERDARHRSLVEESPLAVCVHQDGVICFANPAMAVIHGYASPDELTGKSCEILIPPGASGHPEVERLGSGPSPTERYECENATKGGGGLWVEGWSTRVTWQGKAATLTTFTDITARKHLEQQVREMQRLETVGRLAGGVAHEFNNLLAVILGYADFCFTRLAPDDPLRARLGIVCQSAERGAELTQYLLAFGRRQVLQPTLVSPQELLELLLPAIRSMLGERIEVVTRFASELGHIHVDSGRIERALLDLVRRARDAMPDGGRLSIEATAIDLDEPMALRHPGVRPGRYVLVTLSDTGVDIDEDQRRHLFEPFSLSAGDVSDVTGLALAGVYGVVVQHGGTVEVESAPSQGTTFRMYLPCGE